MDWLYTFLRGNGKRREIGPCATEDEAQEAFQRIYGYWPDTAVSRRPWPESLAHEE